MTITEYRKCEKLMNEAITTIRWAKEDYSDVRTEKKGGLSLETLERRADQHYGEAKGVYFTLSAIGFRHADMKILENLV